MGLLYWVLIIIFIAVVIYIVIGFIAAMALTKVGPHPQFDDDPGDFGVDFEDVTFFLAKIILSWQPGISQIMMLKKPLF